MGRYLIVTWDGAGNLAPTLGIARTIVERGHDVRLLGHDTIAERCGDVGARFVPLTQGEGWDAMDDPDDFEAEVKLMIEELCFSSIIARDVAQELAREPADAVLVDSMLFTAIDVALASGTPTAALFHTPYTIFRDGPLVEMFAPGLPIANAHRAELGLPAIVKLGDIHDACAHAIVALPKEFEPEAPDAANVLRIDPCSTHLRCLARSTRSTWSATGRRRWSWSVSAPASRARPTCCSGASMRSRSCRCAPS